MKLAKDFNLTENFRINEFLSNYDEQDISVFEFKNIESLAEHLQLLRNVVGSIDVTENGGGFRGMALNEEVGGTVNPPSHHTTGLAADIKFDFRSWNRESLTKLLKAIGFTNVNFYWNSKRTSWAWLHVDIGYTWNKQEFNYRDLDANTQKVIEV